MMAPRRILMVSDSYPPLIGGATRAVQLLSKALVARGHSVTVVTMWQPRLPTQEDDDAVRVFRVRPLASRIPRISGDPTRLHHPPLPDPVTVWTLRRIIRQIKPDVVHSYGWMTYSGAAALIGTSIPLIISARDYGNVCAVRTLLRRRPAGSEICSGPAPIKCLACAYNYYGPLKALGAVGGVLGGRALLRRKMRALHSVSTYVQRVMQRHLLPRRATGFYPVEAVIPSFHCQAPDADVDRHILAQLPAEPYILFVGVLRLCKGLEPLFEAYGQLVAPPPLVLIGTPAPDTPERFPPGVTLLYNVPHPTVMAAWERALFGVAPSILPEPLAGVVREAMSKGKPVIGTMPGGTGDMIVDGESGLLVPAGDVGALRNAMQRLTDDEELRCRLGRKAGRQAARFTVDAVMPRFEALYDQVLGG
jgi:glycosyltransferase involved in cell wall biosynthesis